MCATTGYTMTPFPNNISQSYQGAITFPIEKVIYSRQPNSIQNPKFAINNKVITMDIKADDRVMFENYYSTWERETAFYSRGDQIFSNPNYLAIVEMGEKAVPFIKEKIRKQPDLIVNALQDITGESIIDNSIISKYKGFTSLKRACKLWLKKLN